MKVCIVSSELSPLAKTGGLGDAVAGLSRFLAQQGVELRLFLPYYRKVDLGNDQAIPVDFLQGLELELGHYRHGSIRLRYSVDVVHVEQLGLPIYLIRCPALYDRPGIYDESGDEHLRFGFLNRATIEICQRMGFGPDIFHLHDWHASLVPLYLRTLYRWDRLFARSRSLLTIHNLAYQGYFPAARAEEIGLGGSVEHLHQEQLRAGAFSFLVSGLLYADALSTVSVTYAQEIQTASFGFGLDAMLRSRADHLIGITNGADYGDWNPETDPLIPHQYSARDLSGKGKNKAALLERMGLGSDTDAPVLGIVSRLTAQKGFDVLFEALPEILASRDVRLVVLGTGEAQFENYFRALADRFSSRVAFRCDFDNPLAHQIYAGADMFLVPSRYEPCGLTQLYSLRYGTVPIVRRTGGLADTVDLYQSAEDPANARGTGFVFDHFDQDAARWALGYALDSYADQEAWTALMRRGMAQDFSWERQGQRYLDLYRQMS